MKTVAIINEKGGTAKTTTTVSLAAALGEIGQKVLVVDLDGQAASSRWMGVEGDSRLADAMIAGEGLQPIHNVLPNVDLAPASGKIDSVAHELRPTQGGQLRRVLAEVQSNFHYDYILLDCPPSLGNRLIGNAMLAASHAIVPVETSILALDGLRILLTMLKDIRMGFDHDIELLGVLACRYDARTRLSRLILSELHRALPGNVFRTVIHNTIRIQECPAVVKSILEYAPDCPAAKDYRQLARELVTGEVDPENVEEVEDLSGGVALDHSDQQTVLDFRHRAAEFFGRPIEDHPSVDASPCGKTAKEPVPVAVESKEDDWIVDVPNESHAASEDAIDEDLIRAVVETSTPPAPSSPPTPPEVNPTEETFTILMEEPSVDRSEVQNEDKPPQSMKTGDVDHWKVRRNTKLVAAGLAIFLTAGVVYLRQSNLFPRSADANREGFVKTSDSLAEPPAVPPADESAMEIEEEQDAEAPAPPRATASIAPPVTETVSPKDAAAPVSTKAPLPPSREEPAARETETPAAAAPATMPASSAQADTAESSDDVAQEDSAPAESPDEIPAAPAVVEEPPAEPIALTFSGMMGSRGNYSASINGRWLRVGDEILGATLLDVDPMFAEVEWEHQRYRLRMGEESVLHADEGESDE